MARLSHEGKVRRVLASRVAWCLSRNEWPTGPVRRKNNDPRDLRPGNLALTKYAAPQPASGGRASSLDHRAKINIALLRALATHSSPSLSDLSQAVGLSPGRTSGRLGKLTAAGLTISPQCCPGRSWMSSPKGRAAIEAASPVIDQRDRDILTIIARSPTKLMSISKQTGFCALTIRRRADRLIAQGVDRSRRTPSLRDHRQGPRLVGRRRAEAMG